MEEGNNNPQPQADFSPQRTRVSFPGENKEKKSKTGAILVIVILLLVVFGIGGWFLLRKKGTTKNTISKTTPTPSVQEITSTPTRVTVDRSEISIEILNGSGVPGEASKLKGILSNLGYTDIEVGNASSSNYTTSEVTFKSSTPYEIQSEITNQLESTYSNVDVKKGSIGDKDVQIIIGFKKGVTPTPKSSKVTPTPTKTPAATVSATVTPTNVPTH